MRTPLGQLVMVRVAPDGASCECTCGCPEHAELHLRRPGEGDAELLCVDCLATALRSWVALHDSLRGLSW
jgi:hypothetical protein